MAREPVMPENTDASLPENAEQFYQNSFGAVLANNLGVYVTCEFLIGTGALVEKSGVLYGVGVNFVTLYDDDLERYVTCDLYSLKFVTFYDTRPNARGMQTLPRTTPAPNGLPRNQMNGRG